MVSVRPIVRLTLSDGVRGWPGPRLSGPSDDGWCNGETAFQGAIPRVHWSAIRALRFALTPVVAHVITQQRPKPDQRIFVWAFAMFPPVAAEIKLRQVYCLRKLTPSCVTPLVQRGSESGVSAMLARRESRGESARGGANIRQGIKAGGGA
jgi:hypothetical protein